MQFQVIEAATLQQNKFSKFSLTSFHLQEGHYKSAMVNSFTQHNHRMAVWSKQFHKKSFIKINHWHHKLRSPTKSQLLRCSNRTQNCTSVVLW